MFNSITWFSDFCVISALAQPVTPSLPQYSLPDVLDMWFSWKVPQCSSVTVLTYRFTYFKLDLHDLLLPSVTFEMSYIKFYLFLLFYLCICVSIYTHICIYMDHTHTLPLCMPYDLKDRKGCSCQWFVVFQPKKPLSPT